MPKPKRTLLMLRDAIDPAACPRDVVNMDSSVSVLHPDAYSRPKSGQASRLPLRLPRSMVERQAVEGSMALEPSPFHHSAVAARGRYGSILAESPATPSALIMSHVVTFPSTCSKRRPAGFRACPSWNARVVHISSATTFGVEPIQDAV